MENFTVQYFIKKFKAIPSKQIIARRQNDGNGGRCAVGWCGHNEYFNNPEVIKSTSSSDECKALEILLHNAGIESVTVEGLRNGWNIADVNNGDHPKYQQRTPKARILAALADVKKLSKLINHD